MEYFQVSIVATILHVSYQPGHTVATLEETVIPWGAAIWSVSRSFCVSRSCHCSLTRAVTVLSLLPDLGETAVTSSKCRLFYSHFSLPPHGMTVSSNVATVQAMFFIRGCWGWTPLPRENWGKGERIIIPWGSKLIAITVVWKTIHGLGVSIVI